MPSKSPNAAIEAFRERVGRVFSRVIDRPVLVTGTRHPERMMDLTFAPWGVPVRLWTERGDLLGFATRVRFQLRRLPTSPGDFAAQMTAYDYRLLDRNDRELLAYHWHPDGISPVTYPHLHMSGCHEPAASGDRTVALDAIHLPTGFTSPAEIVRLLITELGVALDRTDWRNVLRAASDFEPER